MPRSPKSRPLTATVQLSKIRMKEDLRQRLENEARLNGVSLSGEIVGRLEQTFEQSALLRVRQIGESLIRAATPVVDGDIDRQLRADLMVATEGLIERIQPLLAARIIAGAEGGALQTAIDKALLTLKAIDREAALRERRLAKGVQF